MVIPSSYCNYIFKKVVNSRCPLCKGKFRLKNTHILDAVAKEAGGGVLHIFKLHISGHVELVVAKKSLNKDF